MSSNIFFEPYQDLLFLFSPICIIRYICILLIFATLILSNVQSVQSLSHVQLFATLWTVACQAPLSMGSPGRNKVVDCHALLQGILPHEWGKYPCKRDPQRASSFAPSALRRNKESTVCNQKRLLTIA